MTGVLDTEIAERVFLAADSNGKSTHKCVSEHSLHIGEFEADLIKKYDAKLFDFLLSAGVVVEKLEIEDFEKVADFIDEIEKNLGSKVNHNSDFLYKHAIGLRLNGHMLFLIGSYYEGRNKTCSTVFGNRTAWYS